MDIIDRIEKIIVEMIGDHSGAQSEFAKRIDSRPGLITDWLKRRAKPGVEWRNRICETFNISREWLDNGIGEMQNLKSPDHGSINPPPQNQGGRLRYITEEEYIELRAAKRALEILKCLKGKHLIEDEGKNGTLHE